MTQDDLSTAINLRFGLNTTRGMVSKWESGFHTPTIHPLRCLADVLGVSLDYFSAEDAIDTMHRSKEKSKQSQVPILGTVAAGLPMYAEENIEGYATLAEDLPQGGKYFALRTRGDSMDDAYIPNGSLVIIRQQERVENGEIAVVMVGAEDATLKYFRQEGSLVILTPKSHSREHQPQVYDIRQTPVQVVGKLMRVEIDAEILI
jgi:repressor LexA